MMKSQEVTSFHAYGIEALEGPHHRSSEALFAHQKTDPSKIIMISVNDRGGGTLYAVAEHLRDNHLT
jgi:hypothetical protein